MCDFGDLDPKNDGGVSCSVLRIIRRVPPGYSLLPLQRVGSHVGYGVASKPLVSLSAFNGWVAMPRLSLLPNLDQSR